MNPPKTVPEETPERLRAERLYLRAKLALDDLIESHRAMVTELNKPPKVDR